MARRPKGPKRIETLTHDEAKRKKYFDGGVAVNSRASRWDFVEFGDVWEMSDQFEKLIDRVIVGKEKSA